MYEIGNRVYVKQSDAPEFRAEIVEITDSHFKVLTREGRELWIERRNCSWRSSVR